MIAQPWTTDRARVAVALLVSRHEHGSAGTRAAIAAVLDVVGLDMQRRGFADLASYLFGRADGLRRPSRSRRHRAPIFN